MIQRKAVIAGGGLAGLACAKQLIDAGLEVELVEAERVFGGRATSWVDERDGEVIESGEHTFFGIYERLSALLMDAGVDRETILTWQGEVAYMDERGAYYPFGIDPLRSLPRVVRGVLGNNALIGPSSKAQTAGAALRSLDQRLGDKDGTLAEAARKGGVDDDTLNRILRPLTRAIFFCEPEEVAASVLVDIALHMAARPTEIRAGTFKGGMGDLMIAPIVRWLEKNGAVMRSLARMQSIDYDAGSGLIESMTLESGEMLTGDVFVSALTLRSLQKLIPTPLRELPYFSAVRQMKIVPAVSVQLWFDRNVVEHDTFTFLPNSSVPVFQDESFTTFPRAGSRVSCQVTDRETDGFSDSQYVRRALAELTRFIPGMKEAAVERTAVVRHEAFASTPETVFRLRPDQVTPVPNFYVVGDFTAQDWYTTMEGAVRSGERAAEAILAEQVAQSGGDR